MKKESVHCESARKSVQLKFSIILILISTFILSVFTAADYITSKAETQKRLQDLADLWANQLSENLILPIWNFDMEAGMKVLDAAMQEKQIYAISVRSSHNDLLYGLIRDENWKPVNIANDFKEKGVAEKRDIMHEGFKLGDVSVYITPKFMNARLKKSLLGMLTAMLVLNISLVLSFFFSIRKIVILPVRRIAESVRIIASGNLHEEIHSERNDEIGQLAADAESMRLAIIELTEHVKEQERLKKEMELARRIQTSLLPASVQNIHPDFEIAASMQTADKVGGDFYDIVFDRTGALWCAIGDVSGHGVTPGLIMMMAHTVHTTMTCTTCDAREAVVMINHVLFKSVHERLKESHFMTFTALKYLEGGRFQHAGAHLSLIIHREASKTFELIKTRGVYLNFKNDISKATKNSEFTLNPGDILVLYTDGLTEAVNSSGRMLDIDGFLEILEKYIHESPETMKEMVMSEVLQWCDNKPEDDMTILIIKKKQKS